MKKLAPTERPAMAAKPSVPMRRLLYVEDEDANWEVTVLRLRNRYTLERAKDAKEACEKIRAELSTFAAILMDIQLKGSDLDGVQLTALLKKGLSTPTTPAYARGLPHVEIPIVFVTANSERYGHAALLQAGGSFAVPKPVDFVQLSVGLNNLILTQRSLVTPSVTGGG